MPQSIYLVDAFCDGPFTGNPAGVCPLNGPAEASWMQQVAMEMNQAETAFVHPVEGEYALRWFTPTTEVDLCGHATLATAHVLFSSGAESPLRFRTRSGVLTATRVDHEIELDFPSEDPVEESLPFHLDCLGVAPVWTGRNRMDWFVELPSAEFVRQIRPDFAEIAALGIRGLIVTSRDESERYDFVSRCFFPQSGVDEDPVTGSAHCALAPYWSKRMLKAELIGYQASRRGGIVRMSVQDDRIKLRGQAISVVQGTLLV